MLILGASLRKIVWNFNIELGWGIGGGIVDSRIVDSTPDSKEKQELFILWQPRSQGFSLFVIGKAGKGPGTGRSHDFQHPDIVGVINYNNND
jgi:hypothetical protein